MRLFRRQRKFSKAKSHFLPVFVRQAALCRQASSSLYSIVRTTDKSEWARLEKEVKQCEVQGDALLAEFYEILYEVLLYPIDRDDLQILAMDIDVFLDRINTSAKSIMLYMPEKIDQPIADLAQYIDMEAEAMIRIISLMDDLKENFSDISKRRRRNSLRRFLYNENHAIVAWLKRGLPMSLEKKTPIV